jgi:hypothetical protein
VVVNGGYRGARYGEVLVGVGLRDNGRGLVGTCKIVFESSRIGVGRERERVRYRRRRKTTNV